MHRIVVGSFAILVALTFAACGGPASAPEHVAVPGRQKSHNQPLHLVHSATPLPDRDAYLVTVTGHPVADLDEASFQLVGYQGLRLVEPLDGEQERDWRAGEPRSRTCVLAVSDVDAPEIAAELLVRARETDGKTTSRVYRIALRRVGDRPDTDPGFLDAEQRTGPSGRRSPSPEREAPSGRHDMPVD